MGDKLRGKKRHRGRVSRKKAFEVVASRKQRAGEKLKRKGQESGHRPKVPTSYQPILL